MDKPVALGNCFQNGFRYLLSSEGNEKMFLVHGMVSGQKELTEVRYHHCWIEYCEKVQGYNLWMVLDPSQDMKNPYIIPRDYYYKVAEVIETNLKRYGRIDALILSVKQLHYGNWEELGD
ncbi:hypothetical protein LCGC14_0196110 [marine sediment metagenome]|uniref:Uncharacterized protein n=1 Tax=marine sediment metagenome TaxID=412755 RepID=A0A0F9XNL3_9ZZZZ